MKTVIVTGGTRGIGAAIALGFLKQGHRVIAAGRNVPTADLALNRFEDRYRFVQADVRLRGDHQQLVKEAVKWGGGLDVYVNCAGVSQWRPLEEVDEEFWGQVMDTNAGGAYWGCQAAATALVSGGSIVNISSLAGKRGSANNSVYCASKFALNGITQALAKELGPRGIRVNAVCPVYVATEMILESLKDPRSPSGGQDVGTYLAGFAKGQAALQRLPQDHEVASTCLYLASEGASAITGQCINVDCGVLPQ